MNPQIGRPVDGPRKKWKVDVPKLEVILDYLYKAGSFIAQARADE